MSERPAPRSAEGLPAEERAADVRPEPTRAVAWIRKPHVWCCSTYFAEGMPYMIVRILSSIFLTDIGMKERYIGYTNFLGIPYNLKFLWAPLVDIFGTKRSWLVAMQFAVAALTLAIALAIFGLAGAAAAAPWLLAITGGFIVMAFLSATNDVAIDAYYIEGLPDKREQAAYSGYRVLAYRLSLIFVRTGLVALVAVAADRLWPTSRYLPWTLGFGLAGVVVLLFALFHLAALPRTRALPSAAPRSVSGTFLAAFTTYFRQEKIGLILAFLLLYKMGDEILFSMVSPFMLRELGLTKGQFSWISGIVGAAGNIAGAMVAGYWVKRQGLKKAILPITLFMNLNIWIYVGLAHFKPDPHTFAGISIVALIHGYEQLAAGLGASALLLYLLTTYSEEFKAAHYALGSAIVSVISHVLTGFSGVIVERTGYVWFYVFAFFASLPSLVLLFLVPYKES